MPRRAQRVNRERRAAAAVGLQRQSRSGLPHRTGGRRLSELSPGTAEAGGDRATRLLRPRLTSPVPCPAGVPPLSAHPDLSAEPAGRALREDGVRCEAVAIGVPP